MTEMEDLIIVYEVQHYTLNKQNWPKLIAYTGVTLFLKVWKLSI